ncbi:MAG: hypothetical protein H0W86_09650 [Armatimonadetes bacterium]|nr:hypothetical protein [Armatimonadota bacterium]
MADTTLLVGTRKGLLKLDSESGRSEWSEPQMFLEGWYITDAIRDSRDGRIWACCFNDIYGPKLSFSDDACESWTDVDGPKNPDEPVDKFLEGRAGTEDGVLFCGAAPGQLYRSDDSGKTSS